MKSKIILLSLIASLLAGCSSGKAAETLEEIITPVEVMIVDNTDISSKIVYAGQITPIESVSVVSKISGKVKDVFFDVGDHVSKDDVLFTLDEADLRNQIRQLEGQLNVTEQGVKSARNALTTVTGGQYSSQILQLETAVDSCERNVEAALLGLQNSEITVNNTRDALENVTTTYNNTKMLYEAGSASKAEFDRVELSYKQAQSGLEQAMVGYNSAKLTLEQTELALKQARESLELTLGDVTDENLQRAQIGVSQAEASRESASIQLDIARETLSDSTVKAPISGVISVRNAKPSEYTSVQTPAFTIVDIDTVTVNVKVSELIINRLQPGQEVEVYINTVFDEPIAGRLHTISPVADSTSMYPVKIEIDNPDGVIKPGMFAEVHLVRAASGNTIVLPRNTVLEDEQNRYIYIEDNGVAKKTIVTTGIDNGKEIEITSGLKPGDHVVVKGQSYLSNGEKINVVE